MTADFNKQFSRLYPLPEDFSAELRSVDEQLTELARQAPIPVGLANRVFEASASLLPDGAAVEASPLRLVGTSRVPLHHETWARLAMAASVAIIAGLALWRPQQRSEFPAGGKSSPAGLALLTDANWLSDESAQSPESEVAYLIETNTPTFAAEVKGELAMLVANMEM